MSEGLNEHKRQVVVNGEIVDFDSNKHVNTGEIDQETGLEIAQILTASKEKDRWPDKKRKPKGENKGTGRHCKKVFGGNGRLDD